MKKNKKKEIFYEEAKEDRIKTKEWIDYWYAVNWSSEADARYYGLKLFWFLITFPFFLINRLLLIITKRDFGSGCENITVFIIKRVIPFIFVLYMCFCTIQTLNSVDLDKYKRIVNQNNALLLDPQYLEEQKNIEKKKEDGYVFLGKERGWYKPQGLPSINNEIAKDGNPLNWSK